MTWKQFKLEAEFCGVKDDDVVVSRSPVQFGKAEPMVMVIPDMPRNPAPIRDGDRERHPTIAELRRALDKFIDTDVAETNWIGNLTIYRYGNVAGVINIGRQPGASCWDGDEEE